MPGSMRVTAGERYEQRAVGRARQHIVYLMVRSFCLIKVKDALICRDVVLLFFSDHTVS